MTKRDGSSQWLELGYELFSEEGHEGLQVERLARILGKNKSGFYHYFGDKDTFLLRLMEIHTQKEEGMILDFLKKNSIDSDFFQFMIKNKKTIMFHTHLIKNREMKLFLETYSQINQKNELAILPSWMRYLDVSEDIALKYWRIIRDSFYSRVTMKSFNEEWLSNFVEEAKALLIDVKKDSR